jgi:hypothetical protein
MDILNKFNDWIQAERSKWERLGYQIELNHLYSGDVNSFIRLNLDSSDCVAQVILWTSGNCHLEVIHVASEDQVLDEHLLLKADVDFKLTFKNFFSAMVPSID